jgi:murein L,D-transpeptidase YcbB/YkuD
LNKPDSVEFARFYIDHSFTDTNYRFLAEHLYAFCSNFPLDKTTFQIKPQKEDSINSVPDTKQALHLKGYLGVADSDEEVYIKALKEFQIHNGLKPDGKIGKYTAQALNESTYNKVLRAGLAMDKMRRHAKYPEKFIRVNLPEYMLRYYVNDSLKSVHNIVCGTVDHQTPELKSKVHSIVVYPYWNVPFSIASKEILPALKANRNYLTKNNYKIFKGDREIDPHSVNWKKIKKNTFPYKVVQQPGPGNSLGIIKFEFHNSHSVYIHDTPVKYLFKTDVRSYSHGCMRCQNPVDLGKVVLDYDTLRRGHRKIGGKGNPLTPDSLDSLMVVAENYPIKLMDQVPVYVEYQSVVADREHMVFHLDIYKRDEEYLKIMRD